MFRPHLPRRVAPALLLLLFSCRKSRPDIVRAFLQFLESKQARALTLKGGSLPVARS
jgi:ABC-type glycerol-3-phosphate transport system substrate-binding protein